MRQKIDLFGLFFLFLQLASCCREVHSDPKISHISSEIIFPPNNDPDAEIWDRLTISIQNETDEDFRIRVDRNAAPSFQLVYEDDTIAVSPEGDQSPNYFAVWAGKTDTFYLRTSIRWSDSTLDTSPEAILSRSSLQVCRSMDSLPCRWEDVAKSKEFSFKRQHRPF